MTKFVGKQFKCNDSFEGNTAIVGKVGTCIESYREYGVTYLTLEFDKDVSEYSGNSWTVPKGIVTIMPEKIICKVEKEVSLDAK